MEIRKRKTSIEFYVFLTGYFLLFIYVILRAASLSFTHDEALSYKILLGDTTWIHTANNHFLNTFFMRISRFLFGSSELALRLPNVLSFGIYLTSVFLILKENNNAWLMLLGSCLLLLDIVLYDFFALARGYGISLGFLLLSIYYLFRLIPDTVPERLFSRYFLFTILFAWLASLSNLSIINFVIALTLILSAIYWKKRFTLSSHGKGIFLSGIFFTIVILSLEVYHLFWLKKHGQLYQGIRTLSGTIDSIVLGGVYLLKYPPWIFKTLRLIIIISYPAGILALIIRKDTTKRFLLVTVLMTIILLGFILEHYLFSSRYPYGRSAIFLVPIYGLFLYYFMIHLINIFHVGKTVYVPFILFISVLFLFVFLDTLNLKYTDAWRYDAHTKDIMKTIQAYSHTSERKITLSNNWLFEPSINYYIHARRLNIRPTDRHGPDPGTDFIYTFDTSPRPAGFKVVAHYPDIGTTLFARDTLRIKHLSSTLPDQ